VVRRGGDHDGHDGRNGSSGLVASGGEHGCLLSGARTEVGRMRVVVGGVGCWERG
jgi:hypothetical protein